MRKKKCDPNTSVLSKWKDEVVFTRNEDNFGQKQVPGRASAQVGHVKPKIFTDTPREMLNVNLAFTEVGEGKEQEK